MAGKTLKSTSGGYSGGNGTDAYLFSALPAGYRNGYGGYYDEGDYANFWSSTENEDYGAHYVFLICDGDFAYLSFTNKSYRFSVRCVKD